MSDAADYAYYFAALDKIPDQIDPNSPQCGYYRKRDKRGGGYVPLAIWREGGGNGAIVALAGFKHSAQSLDGDQIASIWTYVCDKPVSYDDYVAAFESGKWPGEVDDPTEGVQNLTIAQRVEIVVTAAKQWLARVKKITSKVQADEAAEWREKLTALAKESEVERRKMKKPHEDAAKAVDLEWFPVTRNAESAKADIVSALEDYGREEKRKADEAARKERERLAAEAAEKAREIERRQQADRDRLEAENPGMRFDDQNTPPEPVVVHVPEVKAEPIRVGGVSGGKRTGFKTVKRVIVTDWDALWKHLRDNEDVRDVMRKIAERQVKADVAVPGVEITEDIKVA